MNIECNNCGAEFDSAELIDGECPYCGSKVNVDDSKGSADSANADPDSFFDDIADDAPAQHVHIPTPPTTQASSAATFNLPPQSSSSDGYHASYGSDAKSNKAVRDVFSCSIVLVLFGFFRLVGSFMSMGNIERLKSMLPSLEGTEYYSLYSTIANLGIFELLLHFAIFGASIVLLIFALKVRKVRFPLESRTEFAGFKKTFIVSCVLLAIMAAYLIVELLAIGTASKLEDATGEKVFTSSTSTGMYIGLIVLVGGAISAFVKLLKLSREKK